MTGTGIVTFALGILRKPKPNPSCGGQRPVGSLWPSGQQVPVESILFNESHSGAPRWLSPLSVPLDFSSSHVSGFCELKPHIGLCASSTEPAWDSLCLPLCSSPTHALSVSLKISLKKLQTKNQKKSYSVDDKMLLFSLA